MRPLIGIPADQLAVPSTAVNTVNAMVVPRMIKNAIIEAGGTPLILPFPEEFPVIDRLIADDLAVIDGLMLPGGPDIDPTLYGQEPLPQLGAVVYPEDRFELALVHRAVTEGLPIFATCRGMQMLNVALGGDLYQDLASEDSHATIRHAQAASGQYPTHHVNMMANTHLEKLLGPRGYVNSRHHQAVRHLGQGLRISATAPDGVVEGIESIDSEQLLGVQWHPENLYPNAPEQLRLFSDLVRRAAKFKRQRKTFTLSTLYTEDRGGNAAMS